MTLDRRMFHFVSAATIRPLLEIYIFIYSYLQRAVFSRTTARIFTTMFYDVGIPSLLPICVLYNESILS
jgi:hypothetical protein